MQHQRTYTEEEKQMQAAIKASLAKSVALKYTTNVVNEHLQHTVRWQAVADKYVKFVYLGTIEYLAKPITVIRKGENKNIERQSGLHCST